MSIYQLYLKMLDSTHQDWFLIKKLEIVSFLWNQKFTEFSTLNVMPVIFVLSFVCNLKDICVEDFYVLRAWTDYV